MEETTKYSQPISSSLHPFFVSSSMEHCVITTHTQKYGLLGEYQFPESLKSCSYFLLLKRCWKLILKLSLTHYDSIEFLSINIIICLLHTWSLLVKIKYSCFPPWTLLVRPNMQLSVANRRYTMYMMKNLYFKNMELVYKQDSVKLKAITALATNKIELIY